jgi:hypothetical protein
MEEQLGLAEEKKRQGNEAFEEKKFTAALELYVSALEITAAHQNPPTPTTDWHKLHFDILSNRLQAVLKLNVSTTRNEHTDIINDEAIESEKQIKALLRCAKYSMYLRP